MAYLALYRKYRPKTFDEVVDEEHITKTLQGKSAMPICFVEVVGLERQVVQRFLQKLSIV